MEISNLCMSETVCWVKKREIRVVSSKINDKVITVTSSGCNNLRVIHLKTNYTLT